MEYWRGVSQARFPTLALLLFTYLTTANAGNVQLDYSVTDESRSCANPGEQVTFTCMTTGGVLIFTSALFASNHITFMFSDQVPRNVTRSVGASTFTATLTEVDGSVLTATLTVVASDEVTGTVGCTDSVNTEEEDLCLTGNVQLDYSVTEGNRSCAIPEELVTFTCVANGQVTFIATQFSSNPITFLFSDSGPVPRTVMRSVGASTFTATLTDIGGSVLTATLTVVASEEVTGIVSCTDGANTEEEDLILCPVPDSPHNLMVTLMRENFLFLSWDPPSNLLPGVEITYDVTVVNPDNGMAYPGFPMNNIASMFVEFAEQNTSCLLHEFTVTAENDAGSSDPAVINETIPITPDVTSVSNSLMAAVSFSGNDVLISLTFNHAIACNTRFGVEFYDISLNGTNVMEIPDQGSDLVMVTLRSNEISGLQPDTNYSITVTACSSVTCRQTKATTAMTTDVQLANVTFVETRVLLSCELAEGSSALGCVFIFTLNNETERFNVSRSDTVQRKRLMDTQAEVCQTTLNLPDAYDSVQVVDWESDGSEGTLPMTVVPQEDPNPDNFVCPPPTNDMELIVGLVVGLGVGLILILLCVILCCCKKKIKATFVRRRAQFPTESQTEAPPAHHRAQFPMESQSFPLQNIDGRSMETKDDEYVDSETSEKTSATPEAPFPETNPQPPTIRKRGPNAHQSKATSVEGATEAGEEKDKDEQ